MARQSIIRIVANADIVTATHRCRRRVLGVLAMRRPLAVIGGGAPDAGDDAVRVVALPALADTGRATQERKSDAQNRKEGPRLHPCNPVAPVQLGTRNPLISRDRL